PDRESNRELRPDATLPVAKPPAPSLPRHPRGSRRRQPGRADRCLPGAARRRRSADRAQADVGPASPAGRRSPGPAQVLVNVAVVARVDLRQAIVLDHEGKEIACRLRARFMDRSKRLRGALVAGDEVEWDMEAQDTPVVEE